MARIKILQAVSGDGFSWAPGDEVDLPGEEASKWADGYRAEFVGKAPSTAVRPAPENTATTSRAKPARKASAKKMAAKKTAAPKPADD